MTTLLAERLKAKANGLVGLTVSHPHIVTQDLIDLLREATSRLSSPEGTRGWPNFTRLTVVDESGRVLERWNQKIEIHAQDEGRTLKVFLKALSSPSSAPAATPQVLRCSLPMGHGGDHFYSIKASAAGSLTGLTCAAYALDSEASPPVSAATPAKCAECDGRGEYLDAPGHVLDGSTYLTRCHVCGGTGNASPRVSAATPAPAERDELNWYRHNWGQLRKWLKDQIAIWDAPTLRTQKHLADMARARFRDVLHEMDQRSAGNRDAPVSAAERPAPTCATCKWWLEGPAGEFGVCRNREFPHPDNGDYMATDATFGCTLHEPAPPGPVAQEKDK